MSRDRDLDPGAVRGSLQPCECDGHEAGGLLAQVPELQSYLMIVGMGEVTRFTSFGRMKDWSERDVSQQQVVQKILPQLRKVAGVLGEASLDDDRVGSAVVGIGVNGDWPLEHFPADLAPSMTSLRELSGGRPIDRDTLLDAWLDRLEPRYEALRLGRFDAGGWSSRQRTTGHTVEVDGQRGVARIPSALRFGV